MNGRETVKKTSFLIMGVLLFSTMSVVAQAPKVAHIWPYAGLNEQSITASVHGDNFQTVPVTSVMLTKSGFPDISGSSISVVSEVYLTCSFDLTGESPGLYDLVADNASGADTLPGCFTVYSASPSPYVWERTLVGYGRNVMYGVAVGDGNGDGEIEVYGASWCDSIYQFKWDGITWQKTTLGTGGNAMWGVAVGDGNGDGEIEVYGANYDSSLYQFRWDGITWQKTTVGAGGAAMHAVAAEDGNGDGEIEVYGACGDHSLYQFRWDGMTWQKTIVGTGGNAMWRIAVGDGNNDGEIEVYGANADSSLYQFKWDGITWQKTTLGAGPHWMWGVAVGDGNGDGEMEVYGACFSDHSLYQFKWDGISWQKTTVGTGGLDMYAVAVGDGDGDGEIEVYCGAQGIVFQFKWDGITWQRTTVGVGLYLGIAVGDGNGDGEMEVYGSSGDMNMDQFKPSPSPHVEEAKLIQRGFSFALKSNPARGKVIFNLAVPGPGEITLGIYDVAGRLVDTPIKGRKLPGKYEIPCMSGMSSGVYFYRLDSPWGKKTGKLVLIR